MNWKYLFYLFMAVTLTGCGLPCRDQAQVIRVFDECEENPKCVVSATYLEKVSVARHALRWDCEEHYSSWLKSDL